MDISPKILAEQTRVLFKNQPFILATTSVIAIILCFLFFDAINHILLIAWASVILFVNAVRTVFLLKIRKQDLDTRSLLEHRKLIILNALLSGVLWAILPLLLLVKSSNPDVKKVPAILIAGDTAPERLQEATKSGFKLLHKPVNPGQLRMVMNHLLGKCLA